MKRVIPLLLLTVALGSCVTTERPATLTPIDESDFTLSAPHDYQRHGATLEVRGRVFLIPETALGDLDDLHFSYPKLVEDGENIILTLSGKDGGESYKATFTFRNHHLTTRKITKHGPDAETGRIIPHVTETSY